MSITASTRQSAAVLLVLFGTTACAAAGDATITGRVVITKALTKKRVVLPSYQLRGLSVGTTAQDLSASGSGVDELSRVVIYLEGSGLNAGSPVEATLTQKNRRFDPEIVVVPAGSRVSFPNADPIFHNVFSLSKVKQFDLGYYPSGQTRVLILDRPGVVQVYCHIHSDMSAAILVVPTALWTRPRDDGSFTLSGVPPGTYQLIAWHRSAGFFRRQITVGAGETPPVQFVIPVKDVEPDGASTAMVVR